MPRLLAIFLTASLVAFPALATPVEWVDDLERARARAAQQGRMIFVDLYADWCGWCKVLEEEVFSSQAFAEMAAKHFVLLRVDTEDGADGTHLQWRYDASSLPTALILDARMSKVGAVVGYAETGEYLRLIEQQLEQYRRFEATLPARMARGELSDLLDLADELIERQDGARAAVVLDQVLASDALPQDEEPWILFQRADALRMAGRWQEATDALTRGLEAGRREQDLPTIERLDLLRYQIARDRGDCQGEREALVSFLAAHPDSELSKLARNTLRQLDAEDGRQCT